MPNRTKTPTTPSNLEFAYTHLSGSCNLTSLKLAALLLNEKVLAFLNNLGLWAAAEAYEVAGSLKCSNRWHRFSRVVYTQPHRTLPTITLICYHTPPTYSSITVDVLRNLDRKSYATLQSAQHSREMCNDGLHQSHSL
jgi:hypothetical protein